ncbi:MAG: DNA recombination protein RmuC [Rickettsiales bacterium]|nr:DNA recombination protein RmuC [Rickettsiales bacterium]OUV98923.1 MAG: hypothetical protein CBD16_09215 [Betaproteobacteria bacterium TMED156]
MNFDLSSISLFSIFLVIIGVFALFFLYKKNQNLLEKVLNLSEEIATNKEKLNQKLDLERKNKELEVFINSQRSEIIDLKTKLGIEVDTNKRLQSAEEVMSNRFKTLANEIFEQKSKSFINFSNERLEQILSPFKTDINQFSDSFKIIQKAASKERVELYSELKAEISNMKDISLAFKHQTKIQGIYGEFVLETILDRSGLRKGHEYKTQVRGVVDTEKRIPDVVVYLPQNKHLIIDSKVSTNAYRDYVNENDEEEQKKLLKKHADAFKLRIKELGEKSYFDLSGVNSPEMVFMFVPMEAAFIAAIQTDEKIFQIALENKILIVTPTTLTTNLKIVKQLWRFEDQSRNSAELASRAGRIHGKLVNFVQDMERVGSKIIEAQTSYDEAMHKLTKGQGNLITQARDFEKLGVAVKKDFSKEIIVKSELKLDHDDDSNSNK